MTKTMTVSNKTFPIIGYAKPTSKGYKISQKPTLGGVPALSIPMMSDYKWQQLCLESRLKNPELYSEFEDVNASIARLQKWLKKNKISE